jgi:serine/threonine protein kinase
MDLNPGRKLGSYEIVSLIGTGGMGEVYKARDTRLNRTAAVKVLPSHFSNNPEMKARFEREARTIARLNHPHICILHDVGHQDGTDYLVMELLEGHTLAERLEKGTLPIDQALKIAREIVEALNAAHRQGIVHRDLKPSNVMLTKSGAKLLDFGLAKLKPEAEASAAALSSLPTSPNVTAQGNILGTLQYMAPEQLEGKDADSRTDFFAFGALLYEMVTGKKAFATKSQASLIAAIMHVDPPDISTLQPLIPASLNRVVKICLNKNPDERWQASYDLALELEWAADNHPPETLAPPRRASKLWPAIATVLAIASIVLAILLISNRRPPSDSPVVRVAISPPEKRCLKGQE